MPRLFTMDLDSLSFMKEIFIALMSPQSQLRIKDAGLAWRRIAVEDPHAHLLLPSLVIDYSLYLFDIFNFARFR